MKPIYKARSEINKLYDPNLKKLVIPSNEIFNKAVQDNYNTVWKDPERVMAELNKPSNLPQVGTSGPFTLTQLNEPVHNREGSEFEETSSDSCSVEGASIRVKGSNMPFLNIEILEPTPAKKTRPKSSMGLENLS